MRSFLFLRLPLPPPTPTLPRSDLVYTARKNNSTTIHARRTTTTVTARKTSQQLTRHKNAVWAMRRSDRRGSGSLGRPYRSVPPEGKLSTPPGGRMSLGGLMMLRLRQSMTAKTMGMPMGYTCRAARGGVVSRRNTNNYRKQKNMLDWRLHGLAGRTSTLTNSV